MICRNIFYPLKIFRGTCFSKQDQLYGLNWRYQLQTLPIYYLNTTSKIMNELNHEVQL
jgi:hypothetical protein